EVSPVLWRKIMSGLSAGRVQSVATRLVVDCERERMRFVLASYWDLEGTFDAGAGKEPRMFPARLHSIDEVRAASGGDFGPDGELTGKKQRVHLDRAGAERLVEALHDTSYAVRSVEAKPYRRSPYAPFRTTTLQQEAGRKLGFTAQRAMSVAQDLYEAGFITYMRTDSVTLSDSAITAARNQVRQLFGPDYLPDRPRVYTSKVKNAQEAHEAIRPAGESFLTPAQTRLTGDQFRLYELIWMRTIASQMKDAEGRSITVTISATPPTGEQCTFVASGRTITFYGFLKAYVESFDDADQAADDAQTRLPNLTEGQSLRPESVTAAGHETRPPARYTEPSLVAKLEELEIGRPSTYASIIRTITSRDYVFKKGAALVPTWLAFAVTRLLEEHFPKLVDYAFTAEMEEVLDQIADGNAERIAVLTDFYFGSDGNREGLQRLVSELGEIDARKLSTFAIGDLETTADNPIVVRVGRYGTYVEDEQGRRANVAEDLPPDELTVDRARELLERPMGEERELGVDPETHRTIIAKNGRYGPYVTEVIDSEDGKAKPRTGSLLASMSLESVTLEQALQLMSLPRVVGADVDGVPITAQNGRYGPYLKKGADSRSLDSEEQIFTITLDEARAIYAQPKQRGRAAAKPPLAELGPDPVSGRPMVIKEGRFGAYVTDGEVNATLRRGDDIATMTSDRAAELLAEKRAKGPAPKKRPAKKAAAKKASTTNGSAPAKKAAKKAAARTR
ncbi:MAG TPA: type I DNA topoisomerase, partial [Propionibacteriaceae bacterium]|nr:type I DNA topoisomerase [Propionibacteriaceae bacterium]